MVAAVTFVLAVVLGAIAPGLPAGVLAAVTSITFWPGEYLSGLVPFYLVILLGNMKSAFLMALLGPLSVWINGGLNAREAAANGAVPNSRSLGHRAARVLASACIRLGTRVFPELGDETQEFTARSSAGLAAILPFLALGLNGLVAGLWLANGLLTGWTAGLVHAFRQFLPHGPVEFTALLLAAAAGLNGAWALLPRSPDQDAVWQKRAARAWLTSDRTAQSLGLLIGLIAIAAALEMVSLV